MQAGLSLGAFMSSIMRWRSGLIVSAVMGNGRAQPPFSRRNKTLSFQGIAVTGFKRLTGKLVVSPAKMR
jgi:hypothetical protein